MKFKLCNAISLFLEPKPEFREPAFSRITSFCVCVCLSPISDSFDFESKTNTLLLFVLLHKTAIRKNEMCSEFLEEGGKKPAAMQAANSFNVNLQAV